MNARPIKEKLYFYNSYIFQSFRIILKDFFVRILLFGTQLAYIIRRAEADEKERREYETRLGRFSTLTSRRVAAEAADVLDLLRRRESCRACGNSSRRRAGWCRLGRVWPLVGSSASSRGSPSCSGPRKLPPITTSAITTSGQGVSGTTQVATRVRRGQGRICARTVGRMCIAT